jgi:hypothetical protein
MRRGRGHGARRNGEARGWRATFALGVSQSGEVRDDTATSARRRVTRCGACLPATERPRAVGGGRRGWLLGHGWAGSGVGLERGLAAR